MAEPVPAGSDVPVGRVNQMIAAVSLAVLLVFGAACTNEPTFDETGQTIENDEPNPEPSD